MTIQAGDWPIDPYSVDGVELAARLNRAIPSEFDALKSGKANLTANNTFGAASVEQMYGANAVRFYINGYSSTLATRFAFQSYKGNNSVTFLMALPAGTANQSAYEAYDAADPTNAHYIRLMQSAGNGYIDVGGAGTAGGDFPLIVFRQGSRAALQIDQNGALYVMNSQSTGAAGAGYMYLRNIDASLRRLILVSPQNSLRFYDQALQTMAQEFTNDGDIWARGLLRCSNVASSPLGGEARVDHMNADTGGGLLSRFAYLRESYTGMGLSVGNFSNIGNVVAPTNDNSTLCGYGFARWSAVWAVNGTIQTSDAREKTPVRAFYPEEIEAAIELLDAVGFYKWLADIEEKGMDGSVWQTGLTAQKVHEVFKAHGLNALEYGLIGYEEYPETQSVYNENGEEIYAGHPYLDRWSANYAQINQLLIKALAVKQQRIEARLSALEKAA